MNFVVAQSFSKNFGLYGERVGALHVATQSENESARVLGALVKLSRAEITTPPIHGAKIVSTILNNERLYRQWQEDLVKMSSRMKHMRKRLYDELDRRSTPGSWEHILTDVMANNPRMIRFPTDRFQLGMFSFTSLSISDVTIMRDKYHVYLLPTGRISVTGCKC